ncbi:uncharacterized protein F4822DRAFT_425403 [Hypoxylon trugodes]|uniref:uncharacterized protein n=1 Tax=Hypoxylon trugodes TaxID=326681 RepID=UPI00219B11F6|nr:uncharacterized protein F4822DRAFT_425403 [Hypoxylon trugodes]KAI1392192.1 hypothetical protein F4822DRAFT_425403 [Hypoxylon trugodes]
MTQVLCQTRPIYLSTKPLKLYRHVGGLMETERTTYYSTQTLSLADLSTELLALVFQQLRDIDSRALASARQLSRRFEAIVTPIQFETVRLNEYIIATQTETYFPRLLRNLSSFTRNVEARSDLDPINTRKVLGQIQRLSTLRWRFIGNDPFSRFFSVPSDILSPHHIGMGRVRLYVEGLPLQDFDDGSYDIYLRGIPASNLVSLKMTSPTPPLTSRLESLKRLLLESRQIKTFHYNDKGQGSRFSFRGNERLPAFEELSLRSYDWNHSPDTVRRHWNFSRLRRLALIDVPMFQFLNSVPFSEFHQLHTLHCEDHSTHLPDQRQEGTRDLYRLIQQIRALKTIKITCHTNLFPIDGLLRHADSLRDLKFRDYTGFSDERQRCPTMRIEDLSLLSHNLVHLHTLELDMDAAFCDPSSFLYALCGFPQLEILVLHTQTVLQVFEDVGEADLDYDAAMSIFSTLISGKRGGTWRSITVNVGGWKPAMVRRTSAAWREQNRRGVYAERCFACEKHMETGEMRVREERGVDNYS